MRLLAAALIALSFCACPAGGRPVVRKDFARPATVAVLPVNNLTASVSGAAYVQRRIKEYLETRYGYRVLPLPEVEEKLRSLAVTDGGQLGSVTPQEVGRALGADALLYTELDEFKYVTTGFLNVRKCHARVKIVDAVSGETLYAHHGRGAESGTAVTPKGAARAGALALGGQLVQKAVREPLASQVGDMLDKIFEWLPEK